jgi:hypothetical protein
MLNILKLFVCVTAITCGKRDVEAQRLTLGSAPRPSSLVRFSGIVSKRRKYSIDVTVGQRRQVVRVNEQTQIVLSMLRPWFDWDNQRVVVDAAGPDQDAAEKARLPVRLPAGNLYLFCRFNDRSHANFVMANPTKRINNYLISPFHFQDRLPAKNQHVLAGSLIAVDTDGPVQLKVNDTRFPIILGFRNSSIEGYTISDLVPRQVWVAITGSVNTADEVIAEQIVFKPIQVAKNVSVDAGRSAKK